MAIRNNNFAQDDHLLRMERLSLLSNGIDEYTVELGLGGDLLLWAQNSNNEWEGIYRDAKMKKIDASGKFSKFRSKQNETVKLYQKAKNLLKAIVKQYDNADEIMRAYSIDGRTPRTREGIESALDDLSRQHEIYKTEGAPWVLPDPVVDQLRALRTEMSEIHTKACNLREKAKVSREARKKRFRQDTKKLKLIYEMGVLAWGVQGTHFITIGMLPKSMVWTKKRPPSPEHLAYNSGAETLRWDMIDGVETYEAHYRETGESGHWTAFYDGAEHSCRLPEGISGEYDFRVRAIAGGKESHWSGALELNLE